MSWLQEGPALRGAVPEVSRLRAQSSLACLTDPGGQGKLAAGGVDLGALKSRLGQLRVIQVEVWGSLGGGAPEISACTVGLTLTFSFPRAGRFFSWLWNWAGSGG